MIDLDALLLHLGGLEARELLRWIEKRWLLPERRPSTGSGQRPSTAPATARSPRNGPRGRPSGGGRPGAGEAYLFHEVDVARAELIFEIRREFALDDEALDLVLSLLDQLYDARRVLKRLCEALATQPAEVRQAIGRALASSPRRRTKADRDP